MSRCDPNWNLCPLSLQETRGASHWLLGSGPFANPGVLRVMFANCGPRGCLVPRPQAPSRARARTGYALWWHGRSSPKKLMAPHKSCVWVLLLIAQISNSAQLTSKPPRVVPKCCRMEVSGALPTVPLQSFSRCSVCCGLLFVVVLFWEG